MSVDCPGGFIGYTDECIDLSLARNSLFTHLANVTELSYVQKLFFKYQKSNNKKTQDGVILTD